MKNLTRARPGDTPHLGQVLRRLPNSEETGPESLAHAVLTWLAGTDRPHPAPPWLDTRLLNNALRRRQAAVAAITKTTRCHHLCRYLVPEQELALHTGDNGDALELGAALHGSFGWPIVPASGIKGVTAHWAAEANAGTPQERQEIFGQAELPEAGHRLGSVTVLDALPASDSVRILPSVLTPHHQAYNGNDYQPGSNPAPPAEWDLPVPVGFLTVSGPFRVDLLGPEDDVELFAAWLKHALDDIGIGGDTSAGYGYATLTRELPQ